MHLVALYCLICAILSAFQIAIVFGCIPTMPPSTTTRPLCCPALTTSNPPRVSPPIGTPGAGLDECSVLRRFSRGICPLSAQLVCSRSPGTTVTRVVIQTVNGPSLVASNTGPTAAVLSIVCREPGVWRYRAPNGQLFPLTGVSCTQGTITSGDYVITYDNAGEGTVGAHEATGGIHETNAEVHGK